MDELKRINKKVNMKQIGRFIGGMGCFGGFVWLIGDLFYQIGVTDCQMAIADEFPEEYASITSKLIKAINKE